MNERICISKKITYIGATVLFVVSFIFLSQLALQSNQAKNSRAADATEVPEPTLSVNNPPTLEQQVPSNIYKVSLANDGYIELMGKPPEVTGNSLYSLYLKRDEFYVHIDTFIATPETMNQRFNYWNPKIKISTRDIQKGTFFLFKVE
jgi:hypothetical protein